MWSHREMPSSLGRILLLAWALSLACARAPDTTELPAEISVDVEAARAFQAEYERDLRTDEHSFLTVIESHYAAPGTSVSPEVGHISFSTDKDHLTYSDDKLAYFVEHGSVVALDSKGRYSATISRQDSNWRVLVHDRDAPLRESFPGIAWFPIDAKLIVDAYFEVEAMREPKAMQTSRGETKTLYVAGKAKFALDGQAYELTAFAYSAGPVADEPLLIPFRDETTGHESYTAGRYLEPTRPASGRLRLDFNRATNPLCAYSEHYNCPMPPRDNTLPIAIRAGAMAPASH